MTRLKELLFDIGSLLQRPYLKEREAQKEKELNEFCIAMQERKER